MHLNSRFTFNLITILALLALLLGSSLGVTPAYATPDPDFVITVKTDNAGDSSDTEFIIPTNGIGYDYKVVCDDVNFPGVVSNAQSNNNYTCTYAAAGTYTIRIKDNSGLNTGFPRIYFGNAGDKLKLLTIQNWGTGIWTSMHEAFYGCANMTMTATDNPVLSGVTDMFAMFRDAASFNGNISGWNTSTVTNMSAMFYGATLFNQPIGSWNTSNVTDMNAMFVDASSFNQPIGNWDTGQVTNMNNMFSHATAFNQNINYDPLVGPRWDTANVTTMAGMFNTATAFNGDISDWDVFSVTNMNAMFANAQAFNQDISSWDTSAVTNMSLMFYGADAFNQNINYSAVGPKWDTGNVTDMSYMFTGADVFNGNISGWDTSAVTDMSSMFNGTPAFNQNISGWDTSSVTNMSQMFMNASAFNQDINYSAVGPKWDTGAVTDMGNMFKYASAFNGNISGWNTGNVTNMLSMFQYAVAFNQDISNWSTGRVTNMSYMFFNASAFDQNIGNWDMDSAQTISYMFYDATSFDQDLSAWNVAGIMFADDIFYGATLSTTNYDALLNGWDAQTLNSSIFFSGGNSTYCNGSTARAHMIASDLWTITDGGIDPACVYVLSIVRASTDPTSAQTVLYTVTFNQPVKGVSTADFLLTTTNLTGASIVSVSGSDATRTVTVKPGYGKGSLHLDLPVTATITDMSGTNPLLGLPFSGQTYMVNKQLTYKSQGANDGWILESSEVSNLGGTMNSSAATFNLGDDSANKQYRAILSFNTAAIPDTATVTKATIKVKSAGVTGPLADPISTFLGFKVDIMNGTFGLPALELTDFNATAGKTYGSFTTALVSGWYSIDLAGPNAYVNKLTTNSGLTQIRLRFTTDDNNDLIANILALVSGNTATSTDRPQLIIQYYVP